MKKRGVIIGSVIAAICCIGLVFFLNKASIPSEAKDKDGEKVSTKVDKKESKIADIPFSVTSYNLGSDVCGATAKDARPVSINDMQLISYVYSDGKEETFQFIDLNTKTCEKQVLKGTSARVDVVNNKIFRSIAKKDNLVMYDIDNKTEKVLSTVPTSPVQGFNKIAYWTEFEEKGNNQISRVVSYNTETGEKEIVAEAKQAKDGQNGFEEGEGASVSDVISQDRGLIVNKRIVKENGDKEHILILKKENGETFDYPIPWNGDNVAVSKDIIAYSTEGKLEIQSIETKNNLYTITNDDRFTYETLRIQNGYLFFWDEHHQISAINLETGIRTLVSLGIQTTKLIDNDDSFLFYSEKNGELSVHRITF